MSYPSQLSENVVSAIVKHIYLSTPVDCVVDQLYPLLSVSSIWRKATQLVLTHTYVVDDINHTSSFYIGYNMLTRELRYVLGKGELLEQVKEVVHIASIKDILRNDTSAPSLVFPHAEFLQLEIYQPDSYMCDSPCSWGAPTDYWVGEFDDLWKNTCIFVENIKMMVPKANNVSIKLAGNLCTYLPDSDPISKCILGLFDVACSRSLAVRQRSVCMELVDSIINLTSLELDWFENDGMTERIIRNNAGTLESLRINMTNSTVSKIWKIVGSNGQIIYQHLQKVNVHVENTGGGSNLQCNIGPNYVSFPQLRHLIMDTDSVFAAELFLLGSVKTIEYLSLKLTDSIINTLTNLYSTCNQSALRQAILHSPRYARFFLDRDRYDDLYCKMMAKLLIALPKDISMLRLPRDMIYSKCIFDQVMERFTKLQILWTGSENTYISQVCELVGMLPNLRELYIGDIKIDARFDYSEFKDIVRALGSEYRMTDSRLGSIELLGDVISSLDTEEMLIDIARCSAILMSLCPQFKQIKVEEVWQEDVDELAYNLATNLHLEN